MTTHRNFALAAGAAWLLATPALAQHEPPKVQMKPPPSADAKPAPTRVAPLTVEAAQPAELKRQTYNFVQMYSATSEKLDQLTRWTDPVCVTVQGLPPDAGAEVKARVEEVAKALNLRVKPDGCGPNIQIMFTDQPQKLMDRVANEHELFLGYWHHTDRNKLKTVTRPIQSWYVTGTSGSGGNMEGLATANIETYAAMGAPTGAASPITPLANGVAGRKPHGFQMDDEDSYQGSTGCGDKAAFTACLTSEFQHVLVVVDTNKVADYSPGLIADYVAMLAMSRPKSLSGCNVLPSVIDLFSERCPGQSGQDGLTRADVAYLTALYKVNLESRKSGQMTEIAGRMADMLIKAGKAERLEIQAADVRPEAKPAQPQR